MQAVFIERYGPPEKAVEIKEIDKPALEDKRVLVRVHAAAVNISDCVPIRGVPYAMRLMFGPRKPKENRPGADVAGTVEAVGKDVTRFKPGDEVFGWARGAFAEYASAREEYLALKPADLTFEHASTIGVSALTALQALRNQGKLQPGQKVLINGASGGVGVYAVQIAKALGAEVTGVCSTPNVELVHSLGADRVIDYTKEDFTKSGQHYDLILDNVGNHSFLALRRVLSPTGKLLPNYGAHTPGRWIGPFAGMIRAALFSKLTRRQMGPWLARLNADDLVTLREMVVSGKLRPVIDTTYPLRETAQAFAHVLGGHARGKVVMSMHP